MMSWVNWFLTRNIVRRV